MSDVYGNGEVAAPQTGSPEPDFWAPEKPGVPHIYIGARPGTEQANEIRLQPVEHEPEFETKLKLVPVDHAPEFFDDTGQNAQETPETLQHQQRDLRDGRRPVQMFPAGTEGLPAPPGFHATTNERGTFHYDPTKITEDEIHDLSRQGRENEFLELGPVSKAEVEERVARGEKPVAITEYTRMAPRGLRWLVPKDRGVAKTIFEQTKSQKTLSPSGRRLSAYHPVSACSRPRNKTSSPTDSSGGRPCVFRRPHGRHSGQAPTAILRASPARLRGYPHARRYRHGAADAADAANRRMAGH